MNRTLLAIATFATFAAALPAAAQSLRPRVGDDGVPQGHRPPPGMCRIWLDGVPPGRQPAPTDCASAVRNRPANGRVVFGDAAPRSGRGKVRRQDDANDERRDDERRDDERRPPRRDDDGPPRVPDTRERDTMPRMPSTRALDAGRRFSDQEAWMGDVSVRAQWDDANGDGTPERITWVDRRGQIVQVWIDDDGDGRADIVEKYVEGERTQVVRG